MLHIYLTTTRRQLGTRLASTHTSPTLPVALVRGTNVIKYRYDPKNGN